MVSEIATVTQVGQIAIAIIFEKAINGAEHMATVIPATERMCPCT